MGKKRKGKKNPTIKSWGYDSADHAQGPVFYPQQWKKTNK
jgi:hypothetical protein